jgi:REP-associated tyrosine transposase
MPNHWHLILKPDHEGDLPRFMHWLTTIHAQHWHRRNGSTGTGPVYQGRYKAIEITSDDHLLTACRYVERNPLRAGLVSRAEDWRWGSLWRRRNFCDQGFLSAWPVPLPTDWLDSVNAMTEA